MEGTSHFIRQTKKHLGELNLFKDEASRSDPFHLRTAILSTRVYIVLFAVAVITLAVFNSVGSQSEVITILNPSESEYKAFLEKYGTSSFCPCSRATISYAKFTSTIVHYHPVCQSIFVSDDWINHLFNPDFGKIYQGDFRALASNYFQLIATFCSHAKKSVHDTLDHFRSETLLTPQVLSLDSLHAQIKVKSQFLQSSTINNVIQLLQIVRITVQSNLLQTAIPLSTIMYRNLVIGIDSLQRRDTGFMSSETPICICSSNENCSVPSGFFQSDRGINRQIKSALDFPLLANVSGFCIGCFPVESLLQSTLECLFDASCLETIHTFIPISNLTDIYAFNISETQFPSNTSIETLIKKLFIEKWLMKPSFSDYYTQCTPILCSFTWSKRNNPLYVSTKLLGLYGGLTTALRVIVWVIVAGWRRRRRIMMTASEESYHAGQYQNLKNFHFNI